MVLLNVILWIVKIATLIMVLLALNLCLTEVKTILGENMDNDDYLIMTGIVLFLQVLFTVVILF